MGKGVFLIGNDRAKTVDELVDFTQRQFRLNAVNRIEEDERLRLPVVDDHLVVVADEIDHHPFAEKGRRNDADAVLFTLFADGQDVVDAELAERGGLVLLRIGRLFGLRRRGEYGEGQHR